MRRLLVLALPLFLAACDQSPPAAPAGTTGTPAQPATPAQPQTPQVQPPAATAAGTAVLEPLLGTWAADAPVCAAPIVIAADSFSGAENNCRISGWTDNGDGTATAALACQGEGQTANENVRMEPLFGPQGAGIRLSYLERGGDPVTVFQCRTARPQ